MRRYATVIALTSLMLVVLATPAGAVVVPGGIDWSQRFDAPASKRDDASDVAVSPDGSTTVVTGFITGVNGIDYATVAYNTATGEPMWSRRFGGSGDANDSPRSIAVSPDSTKVAVTGQSWSLAGQYDYTTIVYELATGNTVWNRSYDGPPHFDDVAYAVAFSPDNAHLFVTGGSGGTGTGTDLLTISYDAATGAKSWVKRLNGKANATDSAYALAVSADGSNVVVAGSTQTSGLKSDFITVSYDTSLGEVNWKRVYDSSFHESDNARAVAISPDNSTVVVTGDSRQSSSNSDPEDYETIAYSVNTGGRLWSDRYNGPADRNDVPTAVAVSPDSATAFVTGSSSTNMHGADSVTLALDLSTGERAWVKRYDGPTHDSDFGNDIAASPDGNSVVVTGSSSTCSSGSACNDMLTIAYDATTGTQSWATVFNGEGHDKDVANALAITPDSAGVIVAGSSVGTTHPAPDGEDFYTVRYKL